MDLNLVRMRVLGLTLVASLCWGCTEAGGRDQTDTDTNTETAQSVAADAFYRGCEQAVVGPDISQYPTALRVGPVVFADLLAAAELRAADFEASPDGRYPAHKFVTQLEAKEASLAYVTVATDRTERVSLLYDTAAFNGDGMNYIEDGKQSIALEGCPGAKFTQFNGGFVVSGPTCVMLTVTDGAGRPLGSEPVQFGPDRCQFDVETGG